jgi:hypothetical protein
LFDTLERFEMATKMEMEVARDWLEQLAVKLKRGDSLMTLRDLPETIEWLVAYVEHLEAENEALIRRNEELAIYSTELERRYIGFTQADALLEATAFAESAKKKQEE